MFGGRELPMPFYWDINVGQQKAKVTGMCVSKAGKLFLCDATNHCVHVYRLDGSLVVTWGWRAQNAVVIQHASDICVLDAGASASDVFICDSTRNKIVRFRLDGTFLNQWGQHGFATGEFDGPTRLAAHGDLIFVSDSGNHRIQVLQ